MSAELVSGTIAREWGGLLERDAAREPAEFSALVERQSRFVFGVAYAVLRNVEDAEDVAQETFFKLFRSGAWKDMREERALLARMAWRIATDRKPRSGSAPLADEFTNGEPSAEGLLIESERKQIVRQLIGALPERLRRPLLLSATAELTTAEIAATMELPEGTIRRLLSEARGVLKQKLARMEASRHA